MKTITNHIHLLFKALIVLFALSLPALAQTSVTPPPVCTSASCMSHTDSTSPRVIDVLSTPNTNLLVSELASIDRTCSTMLLVPPLRPIEKDLYRLDCYRLLYEELAASIPSSGEYAPIKQALQKAADDLDRIVTANLDPEAPQIRVRERGKGAAPASKPIRAIKKAAKAVAYAQAERIIAETAAVILRSGEIPTRRNAHYTRVSTAVTASLVVLRSA